MELDEPLSSVKDLASEKLRIPCSTWCNCKSRRPKKNLINNCIEMCIASVAMEARKAECWEVDYEPKLDLKVVMPARDHPWPVPANVENFRKTCEERCQDRSLILPGHAGRANCVSMCIKGMADEVKPQVPYELNLKLGMQYWRSLYAGKQPAKQTQMARKPKWNKQVERSKWQRRPPCK